MREDDVLTSCATILRVINWYKRVYWIQYLNQGFLFFLFYICQKNWLCYYCSMWNTIKQSWGCNEKGNSRMICKNPEIAKSILQSYEAHKNGMLVYTKENLAWLRKILGIQSHEWFFGMSEILALKSYWYSGFSNYPRTKNKTIFSRKAFDSKSGFSNQWHIPVSEVMLARRNYEKHKATFGQLSQNSSWVWIPKNTCSMRSGKSIWYQSKISSLSKGIDAGYASDTFGSKQTSL